MYSYNKEELRDIFQRPFNQEEWKGILWNLFHADKIRTNAELFSDPEDKEKGYYIGSMETSDKYRIGLFYYVIETGSVAHKKVGLRNLVKKFINANWGEFDAALVVFDDNKEWRLSFVCDIKEEATSPKRFTFVFGEQDNFYRTAVDRFMDLQKAGPSFENIRKAFSVDALSDDFFEEYRNQYADFVMYITGKRYVKEGNKWVERTLGRPNSQYVTTFESDDKLVRDYIKKMFGRIVFLYFLQRKGWLNGNRQYMHDLFYNSAKKDNFLDGVLEPLFFEILNEKPENRTSEAKKLPGNENIPYLNGGLFAKDEIDERTCVFPAEYFKKLFDFLDSYNFTIDENDTDDAEIGIDPEMLGRIFENLLEDNKDKGAFYTPKEIVDYMCRESIIAYLQDDKFSESGNETIRNFVENYDGSALSIEQRKYLRDKLKTVKICDPAIGSGAFPMGLVNLLSKLYSVLRLSTDAAVIKRHIMEQNIYGVDIEKGAVDIARLRFWLAMIVEEKDPIPLPNLHFKIMQGNSLLESYNGIDLSDLTKVKDGTSIFEWNNGDKMSLVEDLKRYYKTSDHAEGARLFDSIIKNVRRQLFANEITLPKGMDPSANSEFFLWHTWFADVFENGGFDIVIGNPPYVIVSKDDPNKSYYDEIYEVATGGKRNLFHLFFEKALKILKVKGTLSFITPDTFISGNDTLSLRKLFVNHVNIKEIILFTEKEKVFENVTQALAVSRMIKGESFNSFPLFALGQKRMIQSTSVLTDSKLRFKWSNPAIDKIKQTQYRVKDFFYGNKGDVNLGIKKAFFTESYVDNSLPLVRGIQISPYGFSGTSQWCHKKALSKDNTGLDRIVFQEVANSGLSRRVKATILKNVILGDSCNFIFPNSSFKHTLTSALSIINSKVVNFYFKFYNQTNHVPIGEFKEIPIPIYSKNVEKELDILVSQMFTYLSIQDITGVRLTESKIDHIVFHLYDLTYDEVLIIDPNTPITREEYENFNIDDICSN